MHTFPDIDRFKATLDQHRPLAPAIVRNLREDLIVPWALQCFAEACEIFHKLSCKKRTICKNLINRPATPLDEAHQGGCFIFWGCWA